jgi:UPF0716 family protein affecting phage T7 exclusion
MTTGAPFPYKPPGDQQGQGGQGQGPGGSPGRRGPRARRLLPLVVAVWAVLEIWLLILVGDVAGGLSVLALLVAGFLIGSAVIKRAGRRAWRRLGENIQRAQRAQQGQGAASGAPDGSDGWDATGKREEERGSGGNALAMLGGLLLMVPGLISDAAGLLCLFPPTASLLRRGTRRYLGRSSGFAPGSLGDAYQQARRAEEEMRVRRPGGKVVEGEVVEGKDVEGEDVGDDDRPGH